MSANRTGCPDCGGRLREILVFARGAQAPLTGAAIDATVQYYAEADAERSMFHVMFTPEGSVVSKMCKDCGRIFFYGQPNS